MRQALMQGIASGEFRKTAAMEFPQFLAAPGVLAIVWRLLHGERHRLDLDAYSKAHMEFVWTACGSSGIESRKVIGAVRQRRRSMRSRARWITILLVIGVRGRSARACATAHSAAADAAMTPLVWR